MKTPVAFLIFNRPSTTERVFEAIQHAKPAKLLVVADGPRIERSGEAEKCAAARAVIDRVNWDCEVLKNYSETNLGCRKRISSGLDWVFDTVGEAIVLEDDCLPHPTFFRFCEELLDHYRHDERIMAISGNNFQFGRRRSEDSYYFSRYNHCWGWASWRRAWQHYDVELKLWPKIRDSGWLEDLLLDSHSIKYWTKIFQSTYEGNINSWAYQWTFACWIQSSLSVLPNVNLVSNIGFCVEATHTKRKDWRANMSLEPINFPLKYPSFMICDSQADNFTQNNVFRQGLLTRIKEKIKETLINQLQILFVAKIFHGD